MRIDLAFLGVLGLVTVVGCGGKVVYETSGSSGNGGTGGAGGHTSTGSTPSTSSTGPTVTCTATTCSEAGAGGCKCSAVCNQQKLEVDCFAIPGGAECTCVENNIAIFKCQETPVSCDILAGCCGGAFFSQGG